MCNIYNFFPIRLWFLNNLVTFAPLLTESKKIETDKSTY